jgi:hypothetical protein
VAFLPFRILERSRAWHIWRFSSLERRILTTNGHESTRMKCDCLRSAFLIHHSALSCAPRGKRGEGGERWRMRAREKEAGRGTWGLWWTSPPSVGAK